MRPRPDKPRAPRLRRERASGRFVASTADPTLPAAIGESEMDVIPFNVPGLPEPESLSSRFVYKPISVDHSDASAGPRVRSSIEGSALRFAQLAQRRGDLHLP